MTDTITPLDEWLAEGVVIPNEEEARQAYRLDNDLDADRFLRKLAKIEGEEKRLTDDADEVVRAAKQWLTQALGTLDADKRFLTGALVDYHRRLRVDGVACKTYKLPAGALKAAKEQDAVLLPETSDALVKWCLENGRYDLLSITPAKQAIKQAVLNDGEVIPGVEAVKSEDDIDTNRYSVVTG